MNRFVNKYIIRVAFLILLFASPLVLTNYDDTRNFEMSKNLDIFYSLFNELNTYYVDPIDPGELMSLTIEKMLESLDPYTKYIPESDVERFQMMTKGEYGGIGAVIGPRDSAMMIFEVFEGFPAHKSGLLPGDKVVQVDGHTIIGKNPEEIHELLQGQPGTVLKIGIQRTPSKEIKNFAVQRQKIEMKSVPYYGIIDNNIGYIKLTSFTQNCASEVKNACIELKNKGAQSLILDLRDNPGGLLMEAIQLTNIFVEKDKKIVFTRGKNISSESSFLTREAPLDTKIPLAVLVNENSASAAEIVSGALQDLDRAVVIGNQTFGKGLVQTRRELTHNSLLKITTSKYYIPSGRCIQKIDYSLKEFQGKGKAKPDSLHQIFYTLNKRPVKDGGGIIPDIYVTADSLGNLLPELIKNYVIIDFVNQNFDYADSLRYHPKKFKVTDELYSKFITYTEQKNFNLLSPGEKLIEQLINQSKKEHLQIDNEISLLQKQINIQQKKLFIQEKKEIIKQLELEIIKRLYFERGQIAYKVVEDENITEAKKYLQNSNLYSGILQGKIGVHKK